MIHHLETSFELNTKEQKDSYGLISGYASVFDVLDEHGDRVSPGAFCKSVDLIQKENKWPKMLWQHDPKEPIGQWTKIQEDDKGLYVEGKLLLDLQRAQEAYALLKSGIIDGLSIGYRVVEAHKSNDTQERHLSELDLLEVSLVTFAANASARISEVKGNQDCQNVIAHRLDHLARKLRVGS